MEKRWYVLHTYSSHENKVKNYLDNAIAASGMDDRISRVVIPLENVVEMRGGKKKNISRKFFPSYVLVEMEMARDTWHLVTNTPGVTGFVGVGDKPQPLKASEVERILGRIEGAKASKGTVEIPFELGEHVKVIDGPFSDFTGVVDEIRPERRKIKVMVSIFGRATPVELDVLQVESIGEQ